MCHNLLVFTRVPEPKIDNDGVTETLKLGIDKKRGIVVYSYTLLMTLGLNVLTRFSVPAFLDSREKIVRLTSTIAKLIHVSITVSA